MKSQQTFAADPESTFITLGSDKLVSGSSPVVVLTTTIYLSAAKKVFLE